MKKEIILVIGIFFALFVGLFTVYTFTSQPIKTNQTDLKLNKQELIYFYGVSCPNCKNLDAWLKKNRVSRQVKFKKREVYYNKDNAELMRQAAVECSLDTTTIGVPFVYDQGKCYIGTPDAQALFESKLKKK